MAVEVNADVVVRVVSLRTCRTLFLRCCVAVATCLLIVHLSLDRRLSLPHTMEFGENNAPRSTFRRLKALPGDGHLEVTHDVPFEATSMSRTAFVDHSSTIQAVKQTQAGLNNAMKQRNGENPLSWGEGTGAKPKHAEYVPPPKKAAVISAGGISSATKIPALDSKLVGLGRSVPGMSDTNDWKSTSQQLHGNDGERGNSRTQQLREKWDRERREEAHGTSAWKSEAQAGRGEVDREEACKQVLQERAERARIAREKAVLNQRPY